MASSRSRPRPARWLAAILTLCFWAGANAADPPPQDPAESTTDETARNREPGRLPPGVEVVGGSIRMPGDGSVVLEGPVTVTHAGARFQADRMTFRDERTLEAEGNVLVVWENNRIFGTTMRYDLETEEGVIRDAIGQVDPEYQFTAAEVRKVGNDLVYLKHAEITTCTQPTPYWSFRVSSARVRVDGYAKMWNARFKVERVPILYFPFLFWPVKEGRAPGLLLPEIGTTQNRGQVIHQPLYLPLGRSADLTVTGSHYTLAGTGFGAELRAVPNRDGRLALEGFWIPDEVSGNDRWRLRYEQTQRFRNGFRMLADIDAVSDFDYLADFERDLDQTSLPNIRAVLEFSRTGKWASLNVRQLRDEQLFSDGTSSVQQTFPEIEIRGRSRKLGKSPLYLSFESSVSSIQQRGEQLGIPVDTDYLRGDVYPTLSIPWSPAPWVDITPSASYRYTYYTQSRTAVPDGNGGTTAAVVDDDLARGLGSVGIEIVGPKVFRIFGNPDPKSTSRYKQVVEPVVSYNYSQGFDRIDEVIRFDEIDVFGAAGNSVNYGVRSRLLAKRPRSSATYGERDDVLLPGDPETRRGDDPFGDRTLEADLVGDDDDASDEGDDAKEEEPVLEPVEIASASLTQTRSFERDLSFGDLDDDGINETSKPVSDWLLSARYNPLARVSFDVRASWQPVYQDISTVTVSGNVAERWGLLRFSLLHRNGLGSIARTTIDPGGQPITEIVPREDQTQLSAFTSLNLWGGRLRVGLEGTYDFRPPDGQSRVPNKLWSVQYSTQCCTFLIQRLARNFTNVQNRNDYAIRVDLRGVGKILDQKFR